MQQHVQNRVGKGISGNLDRAKSQSQSLHPIVACLSGTQYIVINEVVASAMTSIKEPSQDNNQIALIGLFITFISRIYIETNSSSTRTLRQYKCWDEEFRRIVRLQLIRPSKSGTDRTIRRIETDE